MRANIFCGIVLAFLLASLWNIGERLSNNEKQRRNVPYTSSIYKLDHTLIDLLSLGHKRMIEYIAIINAIQYYADFELRAKITYESLHQGIIKPVLALKPRLDTFYMLTCYLTAFDFKRPDMCESINQAGLAALPDNWRIAMTQGFIEKFVLKNDAKAALYYKFASTKKGCPPYIASLATRLANNDPKVFQDPNFINSILELPDSNRLIDELKKSLKNSPTEEAKP